MEGQNKKSLSLDILSEMIEKFHSKRIGKIFYDEKDIRAHLVYSVLQLCCSNRVNVAPRTIQTVASDSYLAMKNAKLIRRVYALTSGNPALTFTNITMGTKEAFLEKYRNIKKKKE